MTGITNFASGFSSEPPAVTVGNGVFQQRNDHSGTPAAAAAAAAAASMTGGSLLPSSSYSSPAFRKRGGSTASSLSSSSSDGDSVVTSPLNLLASAWGAGGVVYILMKAILRVLPIALEPFSKFGGTGEALTTLQLGAYIITCLFFAYAEGYKGFQKKFSPLVISRSFTLFNSDSATSTKIHHVLLAPAYSMGLFHATKKRAITSWSVTIGVAAVVAAVKRLPYPWRNIVDAGVVVGLTWGSITIAGGYLVALATGNGPDKDPSLPKGKQD